MILFQLELLNIYYLYSLYIVNTVSNSVILPMSILSVYFSIFINNYYLFLLSVIIKENSQNFFFRLLIIINNILFS